MEKCVQRIQKRFWNNIWILIIRNPQFSLRAFSHNENSVVGLKYYTGSFVCNHKRQSCVVFYTIIVVIFGHEIFCKFDATLRFSKITKKGTSKCITYATCWRNTNWIPQYHFCRVVFKLIFHYTYKVYFTFVLCVSQHYYLPSYNNNKNNTVLLVFINTKHDNILNIHEFMKSWSFINIHTDLK